MIKIGIVIPTKEESNYSLERFLAAFGMTNINCHPDERGICSNKHRFLAAPTSRGGMTKQNKNIIPPALA